MIVDKETGQELESIGGIYQYNFGEKKLNSSVTATLIIKGENISSVTASADCSCTSTSPNVIDKNTVEIDIIYKSTHVLHTINRSVFINYTEGQENKLREIKIDGQIVN
jgi:hypothetical protein